MKQSSGQERKNAGKKMWVLPVLCVAAFLVAGLISKCCFQLVLVQGDSMEPAYHSGQLVLIDKLGGHYEAGDVIAFYSEKEGICVIKRIAAGPGEPVPMLTAGGEGTETPAEDGNGAADVLPEDGYFVLGDNPEHSIDSRDPRIGIVKRSAILGTVLTGI